MGQDFKCHSKFHLNAVDNISLKFAVVNNHLLKVLSLIRYSEEKIVLKKIRFIFDL